MPFLISCNHRQSQSLKFNLETQSYPLADRLTEVVEAKTLPNSSVQHIAAELLHGATSNITRATEAMDQLFQRLTPVSPLPPFVRTVDIVELYRWPATMAALSVFILLCLILIFGVVRRVRCLLVLYVQLGRILLSPVPLCSD